MGKPSLLPMAMFRMLVIGVYEFTLSPIAPRNALALAPVFHVRRRLLSISRSVGCSALGLAGTIISQPANAEAFTFPNAEFMQDQTAGMRAAYSFVARALPPGISMSAAIGAVERAEAGCHIPADTTRPVTCEYSILARPEGGDMGENVWTVQLFPGSDGRLQNATVVRSRVGMPGDLAATPAFHWPMP